ncbi:MAG: hypothetical protein ACYS9X_18980, partial [Planctomycetota bacterium]
DASAWTFTGSVVLRRFFDHKEDPLSMSATRRLASMKGSNWTQWVTEDWLRKEGHVKDEFLETRRALVPVLDHDGVGPAPDWRHYAVRPTRWEGRKGLDPTPHPLPEWRGLDFDDREWTIVTGSAPRTRDRKLKPPRGTTHHYIRIPFTIEDTDLLAWNLYLKKWRGRTRAVVYVNGQCVAWLWVGRGKVWSVELRATALRHLTPGGNVLAIRASNMQADTDIGLYAEGR